ncbi:hypothetical protein P0W64_01845 [Tsukamurella sp. 8F]|uniref:hypothetical protein n=1 Tax=unclassified Tsukamurella TaxID=2633480 RepID=UPI0023B9DB2D|nr:MULTISPECIES: hypothetical protein [unclassified Tsukamurella]MDF0528553.1 hypothetical protein [Tsukamurella sp. 8J]MDF0585515.1 hypothetical protein [Tsukamurella sp. 8F]
MTGYGHPPQRGGSVVTAVVVGAMVVALAAAATFVYVGVQIGSRAVVGRAVAITPDYGRADQVAVRYARGAAAIDYRRIDAWKSAVVWHTSPELKARLEGTFGAMTSLVTGMQWVSTVTGEPDAVRRQAKGLTAVVDVFMHIRTVSSAAAQGSSSTVQYVITLDGARDWLITDVGAPGTPR